MSDCFNHEFDAMEQRDALDGEGLYQDATTKTCRSCGTGGLHWQQAERGWRLFTEAGEMHTCSRAPMSKPAEPMNTLAREIIEINTANGWNVLKPEQWEDAYKIPGILALIHSEVSEALEAFRKDDRDNFIEELADVVIRVLDCSGGLGMDMDAAIRAKLEKNKTRGFRHGGKRV